MKRIAIDLNKETDRQKVKATWRRAAGYVPGEPNQGLVAEIEGSPARLAEYDDSAWDVCDDICTAISKGVAFGWWRLTLELPESIDGQSIAGWQVLFEANIDDYGEIWVDGAVDLVNGVPQGFNKQQRVTVAREAEPGKKHVVACLAINGPLGKPGGGIFFRYATLAFETYRL